MKYVVYSIMILFFFACGKEDTLTNEIDFSNPYAIEDNTSDAVQHERFLIYQDFGLSVYFNDTINEVLVRNDIYGNPVYRYETIDAKWTFFNDADQAIAGDLEYVYTQGEERQLNALKMVRLYCEKSSKVLRPAMMLVVDTIFNVNGDTRVAYDNRSNFRALLWAGLADKDTLTVEGEISELKKNFVETRMANYEDVVNEFGSVSESQWYGNTHLFTYPTSDIYGLGTYVGRYAQPESLFGVNTIGDYDDMASWNLYYAWYGAYFEANDYYERSKVAYCAVVGPYGFVHPWPNTAAGAPTNVDQDLGYFLDLMLFYSREEFEHYWGGYPLVMEKYEILYDLLVNEFNIEL